MAEIVSTVTRTDSRGHVWPHGPDYDDDMQCQRCGLSPMEASARKCSYLNGPALAEVSEATRRWNEIRHWMVKRFEEDLDEIGRKSVEYGGRDFDIMGKAMETLLPGSDQLDPATRETAGKEMAVAFYALGKAARLFSAWERGRPPGDDSWFDLGVYALMARYVRENGRWM